VSSSTRDTRAFSCRNFLDFSLPSSKGSVGTMHHDSEVYNSFVSLITRVIFPTRVGNFRIYSADKNSGQRQGQPCFLTRHHPLVGLWTTVSLGFVAACRGGRAGICSSTSDACAVVVASLSAIHGPVYLSACAMRSLESCGWFEECSVSESSFGWYHILSC
jgi:hypothetical protein